MKSPRADRMVKSCSFFKSVSLLPYKISVVISVMPVC